jgi:hypothetical protein
MFWKIFAWINLLINLPLLFAAIILLLSELHLIDFAVFVFNDFPLLIFPLLYAYPMFDFRYCTNIYILKALLVFTFIYNSTHIAQDLFTYNFTSFPGLIFDLSIYVLTFLAIYALALYIMLKYNLTFLQIFTHQHKSIK